MSLFVGNKKNVNFDDLALFQEDGLRQVLQEMEALYEQNQTDVWVSKISFTIIIRFVWILYFAAKLGGGDFVFVLFVLFWSKVNYFQGRL